MIPEGQRFEAEMPTAGEGLLGKGSESLPHELGDLEVHGVGCEDRLKIFLYFSYPAWPRIGQRIPRVGLYGPRQSD